MMGKRKINSKGLSFGKDYIVLTKRIKNNVNGNPRYNITVFNKEGRNVGYSLKNEGRINYKLLKDNSFNLKSYNIEGTINELFSNLEK